jgi:hypothetical protein
MIVSTGTGAPECRNDIHDIPSNPRKIVTVQSPPSDSPRIDGFRSSTHPTTRCFWVGWVERSETHRRAGEGGV